jgi:hypothetical protein
MNTSESLTSFLPAFLEAQKQITFAIKDSVNPHLKSKYADLPSVIDAVKIALNSNGIVFMQSPGKTSDMHISLVTRLMHSSGEWIESELTMPIVKNDPQGFGSALTYGRRYSLAAITGLYQDDDDGQKATNTKKKETISGTDGAFEKLSPTNQHKLLGIRDELDALFSDSKDDELFSLWHGIPSQEEKIALWSLMGSKIRSHIKKLDSVKRKAA